MRGAGANFGVVTSFEVAAHPVPRTVIGGDLVYAGEKGPEVLRRLRELALTASTDLYFFALYGLAEPLPGIPAQLHGRLVLTVFAAHLEHGEWVRTSATALSAYVYPATAAYLRELERWLADEGLRSDLLVMQINGGCADVDQCLKVPVALTHSGPAAAPVAARHTARRVAQAVAREVITIDMGGTSFDVTLMQRGRVPLARGLEIDHQPIGVPGVDLHSIGSGGGSLAAARCASDPTRPARRPARRRTATAASTRR